jgi:hypothetical protein
METPIYNLYAHFSGTAFWYGETVNPEEPAT